MAAYMILRGVQMTSFHLPSASFEDRGWSINVATFKKKKVISSSCTGWCLSLLVSTFKNLFKVNPVYEDLPSETDFLHKKTKPKRTLLISNDLALPEYPVFFPKALHVADYALFCKSLWVKESLKLRRGQKPGLQCLMRGGSHYFSWVSLRWLWRHRGWSLTWRHCFLGSD